MIVYCKHCGAKGELDDQFAGTEVQCPQCGKSFSTTGFAVNPRPAPPNHAQSCCMEEVQDEKYTKPVISVILLVFSGLLIAGGILSVIDGNLQIILMGIFSGCLLLGFSHIVARTSETAFYARKSYELQLWTTKKGKNQ